MRLLVWAGLALVALFFVAQVVAGIEAPVTDWLEWVDR
jgi:hypothetical protein